jgi:hypothetical protein
MVIPSMVPRSNCRRGWLLQPGPSLDGCDVLGVDLAHAVVLPDDHDDILADGDKIGVGD